MLIKVKVYPDSKKEDIVEKEPGQYEVRVKEKAVDGMANKATIKALANHFNLPEEKVRLIRGFRERTKIVDIAIEKKERDVSFL